MMFPLSSVKRSCVDYAENTSFRHLSAYFDQIYHQQKFHQTKFGNVIVSHV